MTPQEFIELFLDMLTTKKLVALFDDLKETEQLLMLELFPCVNENADRAEEIWKEFRDNNDVQLWWDSLGKKI